MWYYLKHENYSFKKNEYYYNLDGEYLFEVLKVIENFIVKLKSSFITLNLFKDI